MYGYTLDVIPSDDGEMDGFVCLFSTERYVDFLTEKFFCGRNRSANPCCYGNQSFHRDSSARRSWMQVVRIQDPPSILKASGRDCWNLWSVCRISFHESFSVMLTFCWPNWVERCHGFIRGQDLIWSISRNVVFLRKLWREVENCCHWTEFRLDRVTDFYYLDEDVYRERERQELINVVDKIFTTW